MKKLRSLTMTFAMIILSVAMLFSSVGTFAFGADAGITPPKSGKLLEGVTFPDKVIVGSDFSIKGIGSGVAFEVISPSGATITDLDNTAADARYNAAELGIYTINAIKDGVTYNNNIKVNSYLKETPNLVVAGNGAAIPTYAKQGSTFKLPTASIVYYNEDGTVKDSTAVTAVPTVLPADSIGEIKDGVVTFVKSGLVFVRYEQNVNGELLVQDYKTIVQKEIDDKAAPVISVAGFSKYASYNTKVTLPKATATDNYDTNIGYTVTVTNGKGENVKIATVDKKSGYATGIAANAAEVTFDNDKSMFFYPVSTTETSGTTETYKVTYTAMDDAAANAKGVSNTTTQIEFIDVSDSTAPVFDKINDSTIPTAWGNSGNLDGKVIFPFPTVIDNIDASKVKVSFKITAPKNVTVLSFANIADKTADSKDVKAKNKEYASEAEQTFSNTGFAFDFSKWTGEDKTGEFTAEYIAEDGQGRTATKTYKITIESNYTDTVAPTITLDNLDKSIVIGGADATVFTVPTPIIKDNKDARPNKKYTIEFVGATNGKFEVNGGEKIELGAGKTFTDANGVEQTVPALTNVKKITLTVTAKDLLNGDAKTTTVTKDIAVVNKTVGQATAFVLDTAGIVAEDAIKVGNPLTQLKEIKLGGFTIANADEYTGFEVQIREPRINGANGKLVSDFTLTKEMTGTTLTVSDIAFTPEKSGADYMVSVRAFHISGTTAIHNVVFSVAASDAGGWEQSAAPSTSEVNKAIYLTEFTNKSNPNASYSITISGGNYTVMGNEFVAKSKGTFNFKYLDTTAGVVDNKVISKYSVSVSDDLAPTIKAISSLAAYSAKDVTVTIPKVAAFCANADTTVKTVVKDKDGIDVSLVTVGTDETFKPTKDGKYTVTYTATANNKETKLEYTMFVGDITNPNFTVKSAHAVKYAIANDFFFFAIDSTDTTDEIKEYTFTKTLIGPDKAVVGSPISGKGASFQTKVNKDAIKFTMSGNYQVIYEVTDAAGNTTKTIFDFTVSGKTDSSPISMTVLSTILIIVGILLILGVFVYFFRFRKIKTK